MRFDYNVIVVGCVTVKIFLCRCMFRSNNTKRIRVKVGQQLAETCANGHET